MSRNLTRVGFTLAAIVAAASTFAHAEEAGTLAVLVRSTDGQAVPNATVVINSPTMIGGSRTMTTDGSGKARFPFLYPGVFTVQVSASGFNSGTLKNLSVSIGQTTSCEIKVARVSQATVEVVSSTAAVDAASTTSSAHITLDQVDSLPTLRNYTDYIKLTPGVIASPGAGSNPVLAGSLGRDNTGGGGAKNNTYILDGVDSTDPYTGQAATRFNSEIIQEQEIKVGGIGADVSARGGGLVSNVVTKSGSNTWEGSLNYYFQNEGLVAKSGANKAELTAFSSYDTAFTFGGPILKDRLWFFTSLQKVYTNTKGTFDATADPAESAKDSSTDTLLAFAKLTWAITTNDRLELSFNNDPATDKSVGSRYDIPAFDSDIKRGGRRVSLKYEKNYNNLFMDFKIYQSTNKTERSPRVDGSRIDVIYPDAPGYGVDTADVAPVYDKEFGGLGWYTNTTRGRDGFDFNATYFVSGFAGDHTFKTGVSLAKEYRKQQIKNGGNSSFENMMYNRTTLGRDLVLGDLVHDYSGASWSDDYYTSTAIEEQMLTNTALATYINALPGATTYDKIMAVPINTLYDAAHPEMGYRNYQIVGLRTGEAKIERKSTDFYFQDTWTLNNEFTAYLGARFNKDKYYADTGEFLHATDLNIAPRVGLTWNPGGLDKTKVYGTWGRYYEPIKLDMVNFAGSFANARMEQLWLGGTYNAWVDIRQRGGKETVDAVMVPDLQSPYTDELRLGVMTSLGNDWDAELIYTRRKDQRLVEDFDIAYTDPTGMPQANATTINRLISVYGGTAASWSNLFASWAYPISQFGYTDASQIPSNANYFLGNLIGGFRKFDVVDLILRKNFNNGWQMMFSYTNTNAVGNSLSSGDADFQGDTVRVDPRAPWMNGRLVGSIDHQAKGYFSYNFQQGWAKGLQLGLTATYLSGFHYTRGIGSYGRILQGPWSSTPSHWDPVAGTRIGPEYHQFDGRVKYSFRFAEKFRTEFFMDIFNLFNRQGVTAIEESSNGAGGGTFGQALAWQRGRALYLGAKIAF